MPSNVLLKERKFCLIKQTSVSSSIRYNRHQLYVQVLSVLADCIYFAAKKVGRPSIYQKHPELLPIITKFIEENTPGAHLRRRNDTMYMNGVSLKDIVKHVRQTLGIHIGRSTIHQLMVPPRKKTRNSVRYKSLINARVPPKKNNNAKCIHPDFHFTCAQVSLVNEMAFLCKENTLSMSVDNKNKVEVGIPATSRRSQIRSFYMVEDGINYNDHDFPHANSKLVPAGYQILRQKLSRSRSLSCRKKKKSIITSTKRSLSADSRIDPKKAFKHVNLRKDRLGRFKIDWPRSGPLNVKLFPSRLIESTNVMHAHHLFNVISNEKKTKNVVNVIAIADGGPDWSVKGILNFISMGFLWMDTCLDLLIIQSYAPGHSRFNPIERSWSFLTKKIVGVILPDTINGEVPKPTDSEGWMEVLDRATETCAKFWNNKIYDSFPINIETVLSNNANIKPLKEKHKLIKEFTNCTKKQLTENEQFKDLRETYTFLVKHSNRKPFQLEFLRCSDPGCYHCKTLPERENDFLKMIRNFGGSCPTPKKSLFFKEHFETFLDAYQSSLLFKQNKRFKETDFGTCSFGCSYTFFSKKDKERHLKLMMH